MSTGLIALLDDIAALSKVVAASLDDAAAQASKAGAKAAGIVIDDAAVTPRYVVGLASERELPIIWRIARGSLFNKLVILLPAALALSLLAPWAIVPLLMLGGLYLCLEGAHKVSDLVWPHAAHDAEPAGPTGEEAKIASAIRTDFILSAEIMAIALSTVAASPLVLQAVVLAVVGVGMTGLVYGAVALIVRADDVGAALALSPDRARAALGRAIVAGMPPFLRGLSVVGMIAMLWVGGGILIHGLYELGWPAPEHAVMAAAGALRPDVPVVGPVAAWLVSAGLAAVIGLGAGAAVAVLERYAYAPLARRWARSFSGA